MDSQSSNNGCAYTQQSPNLNFAQLNSSDGGSQSKADRQSQEKTTLPFQFNAANDDLEIPSFTEFRSPKIDKINNIISLPSVNQCYTNNSIQNKSNQRRSKLMGKNMNLVESNFNQGFSAEQVLINNDSGQKGQVSSSKTTLISSSHNKSENKNSLREKMSDRENSIPNKIGVNYSQQKNLYQSQQQYQNQLYDYNQNIAEQIQSIIMKQREESLRISNNRPISNQIIETYADTNFDSSEILKSGGVINTIKNTQNGPTTKSNNIKQKNYTPQTNRKQLNHMQNSKDGNQTPFNGILISKAPLNQQQYLNQTGQTFSSSVGVYYPGQTNNNLNNQPQHIRRFLSNIPNGMILSNNSQQNSDSKNTPSGMLMINSASPSIQDNPKTKQLSENNGGISFQKIAGGISENRFSDIQTLLRKKHLKIRSKTSKLTRQNEDSSNSPDFNENDCIDFKVAVQNDNKLQFNLKPCAQQSNQQQLVDQLVKNQQNSANKSLNDMTSLNRLQQSLPKSKNSQKFQHIIEFSSNPQSSQFDKSQYNSVNFHQFATAFSQQQSNNINNTNNINLNNFNSNILSENIHNQDYVPSKTVNNSKGKVNHKLDGSTYYTTSYQNNFNIQGNTQSGNNFSLNHNQSTNNFSSRAQSIKLQNDPSITATSHPYENSHDNGILLPNLNLKNSSTTKNEYIQQGTPSNLINRKQKGSHTVKQNSPNILNQQSNGGSVKGRESLKLASKQNRRKINTILKDKNHSSNQPINQDFLKTQYETSKGQGQNALVKSKKSEKANLSELKQSTNILTGKLIYSSHGENQQQNNHPLKNSSINQALKTEIQNWVDISKQNQQTEVLDDNKKFNVSRSLGKQQNKKLNGRDLAKRRDLVQSDSDIGVLAMKSQGQISCNSNQGAQEYYEQSFFKQSAGKIHKVYQNQGAASETQSKSQKVRRRITTQINSSSNQKVLSDSSNTNLDQVPLTILKKSQIKQRHTTQFNMSTMHLKVIQQEIEIGKSRQNYQYSINQTPQLHEPFDQHNQEQSSNNEINDDTEVNLLSNHYQGLEDQARDEVEESVSEKSTNENFIEQMHQDQEKQNSLVLQDDDHQYFYNQDYQGNIFLQNNQLLELQPITENQQESFACNEKQNQILSEEEDDIVKSSSPSKPFESQTASNFRFSPKKKIVKQRMIQIKPVQKNLIYYDEGKSTATPNQKSEKQSASKFSETAIIFSEEQRIKNGVSRFNQQQSYSNQRNNDVLINMNMTRKNETRAQILTSFKQSVLNIQKINVPQQAAQQNIAPKTPEKFGISKRIVFRRRDRMKDRNLIIIYYDGVLGDSNYSQSYNNLRFRNGAMNGLRKLYAWSQVVIVMPYVTKRAKVIATYIEKHQGCPVDAIYSLREKQLGKTKDKWFRYHQIFEDFNIDDEEKIISNVLILGSYNKEIYDKNEFEKDFKQDIANRFAIEPSLKLSKLSSIQLEGCSCLSLKQQDQNSNSNGNGDTAPCNRVNPITVLVPHLKLETNNCNFFHVMKGIEGIRHFHLNNLQKDKLETNNEQSNKKLLHQSNNVNRSMQSTSIEQSDYNSKKTLNKSKKGHEFTNLNFLELFYQIQEQKSIKQSTIKDLKSLILIENKELQSHIFKHELVEDYLKERCEKRKTTIVQKKFKALTDIENNQPTTFEDMHPQIASMFSFQSMLCANESLNNAYIQNYRKKYLGEKLQCTAEEVMNQPVFHDESQMTQKTVWEDIPFPTLNYFQSHRFFVVKGFNSCNSHQLISNTTNINNANGNNSHNLYEYIDVQREMGEFLPNEINNIINNQSYFDVQDWLCKKMFARPMNQIIARKKANAPLNNAIAN